MGLGRYGRWLLAAPTLWVAELILTMIALVCTWRACRGRADCRRRRAIARALLWTMRAQAMRARALAFERVAR